MAWDDVLDNFGYVLQVGSNRMARSSMISDIKSRARMAEKDEIADWLPYLPEKRLTKSLKEDLSIILAKKLADRTKDRTKSKQAKDDDKVYPEDGE